MPDVAFNPKQSFAQTRWLSAGDKQLQPSTSLEDAVSVVTKFVPQNEAQQKARYQILRFAHRHSDALHRSCVAGHFTASAWLVNHRVDAGLVLLHAKVGRWLQPGGHADGDACLAAVALRECEEETGIAGLKVSSEPVDIDVHVFRDRHLANRGLTSRSTANSPDPLHLDVRYVVQAPSDAVVNGNHESEQLRWVDESELEKADLDLDEGTLRLASYGFALAHQLADRR